MSYISLKGLNGCGCGSFGCACGCSGFGADVASTFNAATVWADWVKGTACGTAGPDLYCEEATRAVNMLRAALAKLGYGAQSMGVSWNATDMGAYKQWASDAGLQSNGMPLKDQLSVMEMQLSKGMKPGPKAAVSYEAIPGGGSTFLEVKNLGTVGLVVLGLAAVGGLGYLAYRQSKSKHHHHAVTHAGAPA